MADKEILKKILSNTEEVKEVVVSRENKRQQQVNAKNEKRKQQLKEAQKNFVQVKANVKPELYDKIKSRSTDGNISGYLLKLIDNDLNPTPSLFEAQEEKTEDNEQVIKELELLRTQVEELKSMSFVQKLRWLFQK